ncbi:MAG: DUF3944 domain-containing protein, partial [Bacteroidota bacterium]
MPHITDPDLTFLQYSSQKELDVLVNYLTRMPNGRKRLQAKLMHYDRVQAHFPDHKKYWNLIAAEIQNYGGHLFANFITGKGVPYRSILERVCKKSGIKNIADKSSSKLEIMLISKILMDSMQKMSSQELQDFISQMGINPHDYTRKTLNKDIKRLIKQEKMKPRIIGVLLASSIAKLAVSKTLKFGLLKGLKFGANKLFLGKAITFLTGPFGMAFTITWI